MTFIGEVSVGNMMVLTGVIVVFVAIYRVFVRRIDKIEKAVSKIENVISHRDFQVIVESALRKKHGGQ